METILALIALTGGYVFAKCAPPSSFTASFESGHKIYFRAVFYACFLCVASFLFLIWLGLRFPPLDFIGAGPIATLYPYPHVRTFIIVLASREQCRFPIYLTAIAISAPLAWTALGIIKLFRLEIWLKARVTRDNDFELLVFKSLNKDMPILVSLVSGKVYAGWAVKTPNPKAERKFLTILPLLSGYRGPTTHIVEFTTNYYDLIEALDSRSSTDLAYINSEDLEIVIPMDQISSAHLFDLAVYARFQAGRNPLN